MTDTLVRDLLVLLGVCFALAGSLVVYDRDFPWKWFEKHESRSPDEIGQPPVRSVDRDAERGASTADSSRFSPNTTALASGNLADSQPFQEWWTADRAARKQLRSIVTDPKIVHIDLHRRQR